MSTNTKWIDIYHTEEGERRISLNIPSRLVNLTLAGLGLGVFVGSMRGGRRAALRFLAENAHRPPRTVEGWYFYKKTKNYRVMLAGLQEGGREGLRYAGLASIWGGVEVLLEDISQSDEQASWQNMLFQGRSIVAGVVSGACWSAIYRVGWRTSRAVVGYGLAMGLVVQGVSWAKEGLLAQQRQKEEQSEGSVSGN